MWYLKELSQLKCEILEHVKKTFEKPKTYEFMLELEKLFADIRKNTLNIDTSSLKNRTAQTPVRNLLKRIKNRRIVDYNQFGTVTGRLTVTSNSFPIMNLDKSFRSILKPNNDLFTLPSSGLSFRFLTSSSQKRIFINGISKRSSSKI
jgi:hypothetical protein